MSIPTPNEEKNKTEKKQVNFHGSLPKRIKHQEGRRMKKQVHRDLQPEDYHATLDVQQAFGGLEGVGGEDMTNVDLLCDLNHFRTTISPGTESLGQSNTTTPLLVQRHHDLTGNNRHQVWEVFRQQTRELGRG